MLKNNMIKFVSLRLKLLVGFTVLFSVVFAGAFYWFYTYATASALKRVEEDLVNTLHGAAAGVDGDALRVLYTEGVCAGGSEGGCYPDDPRYWQQVAWLARVHAVEPRAEPYTYIRGEKPKELIFITSAGAVRRPPFGAKFLQHYIANNPEPNYQGLLTTTLEPAYTDAFGRWVSGYTPIYDSQGNVVAAMGIDFHADYVDEVQAGILNSMVLAFSITYGALFGLVYLASNAFSEPIVRLTRAADQIGEGAYEQGLNGLAASRAQAVFPDEISRLAEVLRGMVHKIYSLYQAERDARQIAETLHQANLALTRNLDLETVLQTLLDHLACLVPYDSANVMLLEPGDPARVTDRALRGYEQWVAPQAIRPYTTDIRAFASLSRLFERRASVLIPDTREFPGWVDVESGRHVRCWLGVPLVVRDKIIGLYSLDKTIPGFFTEEHKRLAEALAVPAAIAIENAQLFEEVHSGRERLRQLAQQVVKAQEDERQRVARELHDEAGQALVALQLSLQSLSAELPPGDSASSQRLQKAVDLIGATMGRIRLLAHDLRPPALDAVGLHGVLDDYCYNYGEHTQLNIDYAGVDVPGLPAEVSIGLYRFVQEALANVAKHARAASVRVELRDEAQAVILSVEDDGRGFDQPDGRPTTLPGNGIGLIGMRERIEALGGRLEIISNPGQGTRLIAHIPRP